MAKGGQTPKDPASPEMRAAWQRLEAGDVVSARREAERILSATPSPEDAAQAQELLRRTRTPTALYGFALLAAALIVVLILLAVYRY
ncbi:molecular chaperone DnaJ [Myxococcaceae bacterium GXIMD 01537]